MGIATSQTTPRRTGSREAKRQAILNAARAVFLRDGYEGASVDAIAELAGVSKQTIYNHGSDKDSLFLDVITHMTEHCATTSRQSIEAVPRDQESVADELLQVAFALNERALDPEPMAFRPLMIAGAHRNPERGRLWATEGQMPIIEAIADRLRLLAESGQLAIDDPVTAAEQFYALTIYQADRLSLNGVTGVDIKELAPGIRTAVGMFISAYTRST
jgi:AcrR family transcriptional regulator